jgi:hypothetical protein
VEGKKMAGDAVEEVTFGREKDEGDDGRLSAAMGQVQRNNGSNNRWFQKKEIERMVQIQSILK